MIKDAATLRAFERDLVRSTKPDYRRSLQAVEALYREAAAIRSKPQRRFLDGIEVKIRLAKALNRV